MGKISRCELAVRVDGDKMTLRELNALMLELSESNGKLTEVWFDGRGIVRVEKCLAEDAGNDAFEYFGGSVCFDGSVEGGIVL